MTDNARRTLERIAGRVPVPEPAYDRLLHRRDVKRRNQRISAAVVAIALTLLSLTAVMRAFGNAPTPATRLTPAPVGPDRLAYGLHGDIFVADANGKNRVRVADGVAGPPLTCGSYWGEGPIWSPDGRYLAFRGSVARGGSCRGTVNIADPARGIIASFPGSGWLISWSPDSARVAAWVHWGRTIGIYGLDGVRQTLLALPRGLMAPGDFDPVWSRDGASLLVPDGVELPIDGSSPRKLPATDPRGQSSSAYSPDGTRVAYISRFAPDALTVAAADGSYDRVLVSDAVWDPVWSPAGDRIAFDVRTMGSTHLLPSTEIRIVDVASGAVTSVVGMDGTDVLGVIAFSSDGARILYSRTDADGVHSLWSVRADGSGAHLLVKGAYWGDWKPVGTV
jgi:Tol biopolymer transport system component